ncbi:MAG: hypothetical protein ABR969_06815 [Sedimentisphaerales bacterium]|jgi:hypothetical protein
MKISLSWLKEYVPVTETAQELSALLSNIGFNTESIEQVGDDTVIDFEITSNRPDCLCHIGHSFLRLRRIKLGGIISSRRVSAIRLAPYLRFDAKKFANRRVRLHFVDVE